MVKYVEVWKLPKNLDRKQLMLSFSLAKVKWVKNYVNPFIRENNPDHMIIHVGANE